MKWLPQNESMFSKQIFWKITVPFAFPPKFLGIFPQFLFFWLITSWFWLALCTPFVTWLACGHVGFQLQHFGHPHHLCINYMDCTLMGSLLLYLCCSETDEIYTTLLFFLLKRGSQRHHSITTKFVLLDITNWNLILKVTIQRVNTYSVHNFKSAFCIKLSWFWNHLPNSLFRKRWQLYILPCKPTVQPIPT